jgi:plasmid maintenance system antidote protein VapI
MLFADWVYEKGWTMKGMERKMGICRQTLKKAITRETDITLKTAMTIVKFTKGEVTYDDLARTNEINEKRDDERKKNKHPCTTDTAI